MSVKVPPDKVEHVVELSVAQVLWLLGQDDQWMRPRTSVMPIAAATGALVDVIEAGAARWVDDDDKLAVESSRRGPAGGLLRTWIDLLVEASASEPLAVVHAINAVSPNIWDSLGADLAVRSCAHEVPRPVRRWLPPRRRPHLDIANQARAQLLDVVAGTTIATRTDLGVLAVASCAGVLEHILSPTAFTDFSVVEPTEAFLEGNDLVRRLTPAVSYLVSLGPVLGLNDS